MNLNVYIFIITLCPFLITSVLGYGIECSASCTCREEHFSDLAIARYTRHTTQHTDSLSMDYQVTNDVLYDDDEDMQFNEENPLLQVATCIIQLETDIKEFIQTMPKTIQALSLVKSSESGNKTLKISYLEYFDELISLDIQGSDPITENSHENDLTVEIDSSIITLKYINFDMVRIKNTKLRHYKIHDVDNGDVEITFEATSMLQKTDNNEILPYFKYKEIQKTLESPILIEFTNLVLVRIHACNLQNIHWEMFDGLNNLKYLILENNNLKFIPNFAFYGTPNLKSLSLARNNLLNIQITDLAGLLELEYLDLSHNNFSQLSELSFPPFPKLKVADFRDNPITIVFPNTFDIMNTTDSIIIGSEEIKLQLLPNSFLGLNKLVKFTIHNVDVPILKQDLLIGMPILKELILSGSINKIEYDAFVEVPQLEKLILSNCSIYNISMDSFYGLDKLQVLDLSKNHLTHLPPNIFDDQIELRELLLNENEFTELPNNIFDKIPAKLIRLTQNPWHCTCDMTAWNPMVINKIKQKLVISCDSQHDKGIGCVFDKKYSYVFENRMAPKCSTPNKVRNLSVFQAIRRHLQCKNNKYKKIEKNVAVPKQSKNVVQEFEDLKNLKKYQIKNNRDLNDLNTFDFGKIKPVQNEYDIINDKNKEFESLKNLKNYEGQLFSNYDNNNNNEHINMEHNMDHNMDSMSPQFGFYFNDKIYEKPSKKMLKKKMTMHKLNKLNKLKKEQNFDFFEHKEM